MKTKTITTPTESPWTIFERWLLSDNNQPIPQSLIDSRKIGQNVILYRFQHSPFIIFLNDLFNNYYLYQMNIEDVYKLTKQCVKLTGFKAPYIASISSEVDKTKFLKLLKKKFYFLKDYEIALLITFIDKSTDKDAIYEAFGLYTSKKGKSTQEDKKKLQQISKQQMINKGCSFKKLMENFTNG